MTDKHAPAGTCTVLSVPPPLGPQLLSTLLCHISWLRVTWMIPALLNPPSACPALPMRDQVSKCHMPTSVSHGSDRAEGLIPDIVWEKYLLKLGSTETVHGPCPPPPPPPLIFTPARPCAHKLCICQAPPPTHTHTQCFMNIPLFLAQLRWAGRGWVFSIRSCVWYVSPATLLALMDS